MWKPETHNKTFPTRLFPREGQQSEIQYPGWNKDTTGKGLWCGEDNNISWGDMRKFCCSPKWAKNALKW